MSAICQVTGAKPGHGHHVSHSHRRTKRRFDVNLQKKRYWVPSLGRHVTLTVSARCGRWWPTSVHARKGISDGQQGT